MTDVAMGEPVTDNPKDMAVDEPTKGAVATECEGTVPLKYDEEFGSLEKDQELQTFKISDDDKRWVLLDPSGGLKKLILKEGDGDSPTEGEKVSCHYSGFLRDNGDMFDSSRERGDLFKFEIGKGSVIKGWDQGIATMKVGERAILRCQSDFAYGDNGSGPKIPPKATLDFVVQLKDIQQYEPIWNTDDAKDSICKKTIKEVEGWETAKKLWVVTVTYTGRVNDEKGRVFCSGTDEEIKIPFDKEFESQGVIPDYEHPRGFYNCLQNTKEGEQNYFKLKSNDFYTFGSTGSEKYEIPPNTDLFYDITVTAMKKFNMSSWQLNDEEKIPKALELKDIANDFFKRKKLAVAKEVYKEILDITTGIKDQKEEEKEKVDAISLACHSNSALVETRLNNLSEASEQIEKGLAIDPKHEKLRYRKALLHFKRGEFSLAGELLAELGKDFPENKGVKALAAKNARAERASRKKAKKLAMKMFGPAAAKKLKEEEERAAAALAEKEKAEKKDEADSTTEKPSEDADIDDQGASGTKDEKATDSKEKEASETPKCEGDDATKPTSD